MQLLLMDLEKCLDLLQSVQKRDLMLFRCGLQI